jgi:hypothetical protein
MDSLRHYLVHRNETRSWWWAGVTLAHPELGRWGVATVVLAHKSVADSSVGDDVDRRDPERPAVRSVGCRLRSIATSLLQGFAIQQQADGKGPLATQPVERGAVLTEHCLPLV